MRYIFFAVLLTGCSTIQHAIKSVSVAGGGSNRGRHISGTVNVVEITFGHYFLTVKGKDAVKALMEWRRVADTKCDKYEGHPQVMETNTRAVKFGNVIKFISDYVVAGELICVGDWVKITPLH